MLVGLEPDGTLRARPMGLQNERLADCDLWFVTADDTAQDRRGRAPPAGQRLLPAHARPRLRLHLSARARVERNPREVRRLWQPSWKLWFGDEQPEDGGIVLLKLDIERAEYWEPEGGRLRVLYAMARPTSTTTTAVEGRAEPAEGHRRRLITSCGVAMRCLPRPLPSPTRRSRASRRPNASTSSTAAAKPFRACSRPSPPRARPIYLEVYAFSPNGWGRQFLDALVDAAARGVKRARHHRRLGLAARRAQRQGAPQRRRLRLPHLQPRAVDLRAAAAAHHRKILLVDDEVAFLGGINIGDEYADDDKRARLGRPGAADPRAGGGAPRPAAARGADRRPGPRRRAHLPVERDAAGASCASAT